MPSRTTTKKSAKRGGSDMRAERAAEIVARLKRMYPKARISLDYTNAFELLIATILAAQSTDARVNEVTKELFRKYPGPEELAHADPAQLEQEIRATGFFRSKTKSIIGASAALLKEHGGRVPETMEELVALPGVGRKTANVVLGNVFGKAAGVVVDTHVARVSQRLALTSHSDPEKIEADLMAVLPKSAWVSFPHRVILHGRAICVARKPKCAECLLNDVCPSAREPLS
ncbi:MAG TPA: endonuclease III [Thermoanaerobaculia bacterium]